MATGLYAVAAARPQVLFVSVDPDRDTCVFAVDDRASGESVQVGLVICEDLWFPEPVADTVAAGARLEATDWSRNRSKLWVVMAVPFAGDSGTIVAEQ